MIENSNRAGAVATSVLSLAFLCPWSVLANVEPDWGELRVTTSRVNVRSESSTDGDVVEVLEAGTVLRVDFERAGWLAVFAPDRTPRAESLARGYVLGALLEVWPDSAGPNSVAISSSAIDSFRSSEGPLPAEAEPAAFELGEVLWGIVRSMENVRGDLEERRARWGAPESVGREEELATEMRELGAELAALERRFRETASGIDLSALEGDFTDDFVWSDEVEELLAPLLQELKRATARPRELDRLRRLEGGQLEKNRVLSRAIEHVNELLSVIENPTLVASLTEVREEWRGELERIKLDEAFVGNQIERMARDRTPLGKSVQRLFQIFFRSRGRNLLLAIGAMLGTLLSLRWVHHAIRRFSPAHVGARSSFVRVFDLGFSVATAFGAAMVFLSILYVTGDWVLLTLASVFLVGIAWASKTALPHVWQQTMLLLNLGPVREHERLCYEGIAWQVKTIGLYTFLENPVLEGGMLRVPIRLLSELQSRPYEKHEPWFPTRRGDWALLADDTYGRIVLQTPEIVHLVKLGGARRTFVATDFLAQTPTVLSAGFRIRASFGIDYAFQAIATTEVPETLTRFLQGALAEAGLDAHLLYLKVEFALAATSSLDYEIMADFSGDAAPEYEKIKRGLQKCCVDACNQNGWVIPFTQITLHTAPGPE